MVLNLHQHSQSPRIKHYLREQVSFRDSPISLHHQIELMTQHFPFQLLNKVRHSLCTQVFQQIPGLQHIRYFHCIPVHQIQLLNADNNLLNIYWLLHIVLRPSCKPNSLLPSRHSSVLQ